jgi:predicted ABC-type transport system involved in lysophospholipase L1 biosynthesis ATPase subunit
MASECPLLELIEVRKAYGALGGAEALAILHGISLQVQKGESLAIVGPSGSGKSTLLQIMGTLDHPSSGKVLLGGRNLAEIDELGLAVVRNRQIGFVFQAHYLLPQCNVFENVLVPTLAKPGKAAPQLQGESPETRAGRLLERVGLSRRMNHLPGQLSGGERQRVAVVRALVNRPSLLLADEPTGSLDQVSAEQLGKLLAELNREEGVALVVVTHARELALRMGRVLELKGGTLAPQQA